MKKTIKTILLIAVAVILAVIMIFHALFTWGLPPDDTTLVVSDFMEELGGGCEEIRYRTVEKKVFTLYSQFYDRDIAFREVKKMLRGFLLELSLKYSLPEFKPENFDLYQDAILEYRNDDFLASRTPVYKLSALSYFFRLYKNTEANLKILEESGMKSSVDSAMSVIFTPISTGYRLEEASVSRAERLVTELIYYMKTELSLGNFTEENFLEYKKQLENVPDGLFGIDKEILESFIDIYFDLTNS